MLEGRTAYARELAKLLALERPLVCFDVETTGNVAARDRIVQLGYVRIEPTGDVSEHQFDINPECEISEEVSKIHGITNEKAAGKPTFHQLAPELFEIFRDVDLCGYNLKFDVDFLLQEFLRVGVIWVPGAFADTFKIYVTKHPRDLTSAVKLYLGEELINAHTALADARATFRVFHAQLLAHEDIPRSVGELNYLFFEAAPAGYVDSEKKLSLRNGKPVINFGKQHMGKTLDKVDRGYLEWILGADFSPAVKRAIREEFQRRKTQQ
jgi:DNA polymerase-3 subunit epsilon